MSDLSLIKTLFDAVGPNGSLEDLRIAISTSVDLNALAQYDYVFKYDATALHIAVILKDIEKVKLLVQSGADPSIRINCKPNVHIGSFEAKDKTALDYARFQIDQFNDDCNLPWIEIISILELSMGDKCPPPDGKMLRIYAKNNDLEGIRRELDKGADINEIDPLFKDSALLRALDREAKVETIKFLIENGADVNFLEKKSGKSLAFTVKHGLHRNAEWIVAVLELLPKDPLTNLDFFQAIEHSSLETLKDCIASGIDVNTHGQPYCYQTSLMFALTAHNNQRTEASLAVLKYLLEKGADRSEFIKQLDTYGYFPNLQGEGVKEYIVPQMKELLLEYGGLPVEKNISPIDALFKAAGSEGSLEDLRIAISTSVDLNALAQDPTVKSKTFEVTALHIAVIFKDIEKVKLLLQSGADPSIRLNCEPDFFSIHTGCETALEVACNQQARYAFDYRNDPFAEIISILELSMGVKRPPPDGKMLRKYVENNDHEGIRCELDKGADINEIDPINKQSALLWCILHCSLAKVETIKFLIENGADVNIKYENQSLVDHVRRNWQYEPQWMASVLDLLPTDSTILKDFFVAIASSRLEILKNFIASGIDVNTKLPEMRDETSLMFALVVHNNQRTEASLAVLKYLLEKGADRSCVFEKVFSPSGSIPWETAGVKESIVSQMKDLFIEYGGYPAEINPEHFLGRWRKLDGSLTVCIFERKGKTWMSREKTWMQSTQNLQITDGGNKINFNWNELGYDFGPSYFMSTADANQISERGTIPFNRIEFDE